MAKDLRTSIKGERKSHISNEITNDVEFHLRLNEISLIPKQKERYYVCFPVECVSDAEKGKTTSGEDVDMARFVQMGKPEVVEQNKLASNGTNKLKAIAKKQFN